MTRLTINPANIIKTVINKIVSISFLIVVPLLNSVLAFLASIPLVVVKPTVEKTRSIPDIINSHKVDTIIYIKDHEIWREV